MKNLQLPLIFLLFILPKLMLGQSLACSENVHISLNAIGNVNVIPDYFLEGDIPDGTQLSIDGENYFDHIEMDCDIKSFEYIVKTPDGNQCWGMCVIEDRVAPVIDALSTLGFVVDAGDEVVITPEMIDMQSYDNCGIVNMKVEPNSFFAYSDMEITIKFSIEDDAGNITQSDVLVQVAVNQIDCELENVTNPLSEITIHNYTGNPSDMTPEVLVTDYGYVVGQVEPTFGDCNFGKGYSDVVFLDDTSSLFVINRTWYVVDWNTTDTTHFLQVLTNDIECTINDISVPGEIVLDAVDVQAVDLTPDKLVELGYEKSETRPINSASCETYISITYNDQVFNENGYTIHREWTIYHWLTGEVRKEIQFIRNLDTNLKNSIICDRLPRIAPVGDCASGHTLDDSVEWPNDITISDYRITPEDLVEYSNIDILDSKPIFYKNAENFNTTYEDLFVNITASEIHLKRVWTVTHVDFGYIWEYDQNIIVEYGNHLVYVNSRNGIPVSGIIINNEYITNNEGKTIIEGEVSKIEIDEKNNNGVNILDIILVADHLLSLNVLSNKYDILAADITKDNKINVKDLIQIKRNILGIDQGGDWEFFEVDDEYPLALVPKGNYIGIKLGDVNDSALNDSKLKSANKIVINDLLLNKGASYDVPVKIDKDMASISCEFHLGIDETKVSIVDVVTNDSWDSFVWHVNNGSLSILASHDFFTNTYSVHTLKDEIFTIKLKALDNTLVHLAITDKESYSVTENKELQLISSEIGGKIKLDILNPALEGLSIYPNPASNILHVDVSKVDLSGDLSVMILNTNGQEILKQENSQNIDISSLSSGMYFYKVEYAGYTYIDKLSVIK